MHRQCKPGPADDRRYCCQFVCGQLIETVCDEYLSPCKDDTRSKYHADLGGYDTWIKRLYKGTFIFKLTGGSALRRQRPSTLFIGMIAIHATSTRSQRRDSRWLGHILSSAQTLFLLVIALLCVAVRIISTPNLRASLAATSTYYVRDPERKITFPPCPTAYCSPDGPHVEAPRRDAARRLLRIALPHAGRTMRFLTIGAPGAGEAAAMEDAARDAASFTLHVVDRDREGTAAQLLAGGRLAVLHGGADDQNYLTFYPRSFDAVVLGCADGQPTNRVWADVHRMLRPGGALMMASTWCKDGSSTLRNGKGGLFEVISRSKDGVISIRINV